MKHKLCMTGWLLTAVVCCLMRAQDTAANNIAVTNVSLKTGGAGYTYVQCDVSWDNSWRMWWTEGGSTVTNWDAAWIFVKYRAGGDTWEHATLATSGHVPATGSTMDVGLTDSAGKGAFLYRDAVGYGTNNFTAAKLRWNYAADGVPDTQYVDIAVFAIEMVYIPEGSFLLGSGGSGSGELYEGGGGTSPFQVSSEGDITCANSAGCLWGASTVGNNSMGGAGTISNAFPNGYSAFYCMKYETTQDQYTDFLNKLTVAQAGARYANTNGFYRHTISGTYPNFTNSAPDRACNYLSWADGAAYADWVGLRPMTELEYEKACRGTKAPSVADEYAWGTTAITAQTNHVGTDGSGSETAAPASANCCYDNKMSGPVRVGIYATSSSTRESAGAGYYGVMEMSGNLWERSVTVGNADGRVFTGTHGDGVLDGGGDATNIDWPGTDAIGAGLRGGYWSSSTLPLRVSDRDIAAFTYSDRLYSVGARAARSAP